MNKSITVELVPTDRQENEVGVRIESNFKGATFMETMLLTAGALCHAKTGLEFLAKYKKSGDSANELSQYRDAFRKFNDAFHVVMRRYGCEIAHDFDMNDFN